MTDDSSRKNFPAFTLLLLASLYFSQGLPSGFLAHALPALLREYDVPLEYIGLLKLLALPWFLKFLWAPFVDQTDIARWGAHRGWIILMQSMLVLLLLLISFFPPETLFGGMVYGFFLIVVLLNTCAATQDIATDGLAVKFLPPRLRGLGNSIQVSGFKLGMIISGSLLLLSVDNFGWSLSFQLLALSLLLLLIPTLLFKERGVGEHAPASSALSAAREPSPGWVAIYRGFFSQHKIVYWLIVLLTYKIADSLGSAMIKPLLIDHGLSLTEVGKLTFWSSIAGLAGAVVAGGIYYRMGAKWSLMGFGLLQAVGIGAYVLLAGGDPERILDPNTVLMIALFEQAADGMSTVALFALMMGHCRQGHEGADYTVQASIQVAVSGLVGALSGFIAKAVGYEMLFLIAGTMGLLALIPVYIYGVNKPSVKRDVIYD